MTPDATDYEDHEKRMSEFRKFCSLHGMTSGGTTMPVHNQAGFIIGAKVKAVFGTDGETGDVYEVSSERVQYYEGFTEKDVSITGFA